MIYKNIEFYTRKHQLAILIICIGLLTCTASYTYVQPKLTKKNNLLNELAILKQQKENIKKAQELEQKIIVLKEKLFSKQEMLKFASTWIPLTAKKEGIVIKKSSYTEPRQSNNNLNQEINLTINCNFKMFLNFINKIESCPKYVSIQKLSLKKNNSNANLEALITLNSHGIEQQVN